MTTNGRMEKKQRRGSNLVKTVKEAPEIHSRIQAKSEPQDLLCDQVRPLMSEVETFLKRREELAEKLASEIEATKKKLCELKKIAASLFPESASGGHAERKIKKRKLKTSHREDKTETLSSADSSPAAE